MKIEDGNSGSIITFSGMTPKIHPSVFICEGVRIIGDVFIDEDCSIWYNTVIRGDVHYIRIGKRTNIQDLSMLHVTTKKHPLVIGDDVSIAHSVSLHGATLKDFSFVGIGACVLDGSIIGSHSIVAAGAVVREGFHVPEGVLVAGVPAKIVRDLTEADMERIKNTPGYYMGYVADYRSQFKK